MGVKSWLLLIVGAWFSTVAHAGVGVWTSGGPYGGGVGFLAIDPTNPATVYAGDSGGIFKSTNSGLTWTAANSGLTNLRVSALAINPANPTTLYAAGADGIFKSTDSGGTWTAANTGLTPGVTALALDPSNPATLYAGGSDGVFKSTNSGGTWTVTGLESEYVDALAIDPADPATLYAGMAYRGVFKSTDSGGTWAPANTGLTNQQIFALAVNARNPATLYAAGGGAIFKSTNSGGTWAEADSGLTNLGPVAALAIDPSNPATLYAGAWTPSLRILNGGLFRSTDSGVTWAAADTGLTNPQVFALAISPSNPATIFAGTGTDGVIRSTNSGGTWAATNTGLTLSDVVTLAVSTANPTTLYAGTGGGAFKSTDSGGTWAVTGLTSESVSALAINPANPATLYAGLVSGGVRKSTDSGGTWAAAAVDLANLSFNALAIDPVNPDTLYAGGSGGTFKSTDSGNSWTVINGGLGTSLYVDALVISPANPATLYAGTGSGVFKSTDAGGSWAAANAGLLEEPILVLAINPAIPATLYAATLGEVFKSTDSGGTWAASSTGLTGQFVLVNALVINPANPATLYAGTTGLNGGSVLKSIDSGGTWAPVNKGLPNLAVRALALDASGVSTLYVGLASGGVWQSTAPAEGTTIALLPTSAHSAGVGGAFYTTDVSVSNIGGANASFTLKFLGNNRDGSSGPERTFSLDPGKSTTFVDVLGSVFNQTSDFGAIRITSSASLLDIASVTSTPGFGGTFGQSISAASAADLLSAGAARSILYIREGDGFRSNLILASNASVSTNVDVSLVSPAGATLAEKSYSVPPNGMTQVNRVVRDMGVSGAITGARLVLSSSTPGALFAGVTSVIDEVTNDATTMVVQPAMNAGPAFPGPEPYLWILPASSHSSGLNGSFYTTNVTVANVGVAPASFTFRFLGHDQDGSAVPEFGPEQTFHLETGKSVTYFDILGSVFNQTSTFGAIRITSSSPFLNIVSVTSTPGFGGTFGQTIPGVTPLDFIYLGTSRSILGIREGDGFRTNLILASDTLPATVDASLVSAAGAILATKSYSVPPNGMRQINRVVRDMGVSGPITGARLVLSSSTSTAAFIALASVIDEVTNDPTTIEAK